MEKGDLSFVSQLVNSMKESELRLEEFYKNRDTQKFNDTKKFILKLQKQLDGEIK